MNKKITAILVAYNPNLNHLWKSVQRISREVNKIIICNNSIEKIENDKNIQNLEILNFGNNLGIGKAQNIGMKKAFENGSDFIIQFDQDSLMDKGMIKKLIKTHKKLLLSGEKVGIIGPEEYDIDNFEKKKIKKLKNKEILNGVFKVELIISSGCLISKEIYKEIGEMKEEWFIDVIDFEYCWRVKEKGYGVYKDVKAKLAHKLGDGKIKSKINIKIPLGSSIRHYYQFRNIMYALKLSYVPLDWKIKSLIKLIFKYIFYPLILKDGVQRKKFMKSGIKDFFLNKTGKMN